VYKFLFRPLVFLLDAEKAHYFTFWLLKWVSKMPLGSWFLRQNYAVCNPKLVRNVWGLKFGNPVGLAAGMDKNATLIDVWENLGFGFVEIGTVTPRPQAGNPKPRLFRLKPDEAIINRMGFNNDGVEIVAERLRNRKTNIIVGGNIGKNKDTPNENAIDDYLICFEKLFDCVDYFVVNVSSPNTPNLRALQEKEPLKHILKTLQDKNNQNPDNIKPKPILLKIAPDLTHEQLDDIVEIVTETQIAGVIATNTTIQRPETLIFPKNDIEKIGAGGLSGKPLKQFSNQIIEYLTQKSAGKFTIVGVGGIHSGTDAVEKIEAGATLVQIYTGFVYEGAGLVKNILKILTLK
jgi:dihydroorotate dehydrogenase